jgi:hypothetical protein
MLMVALLGASLTGAQETLAQIDRRPHNSSAVNLGLPSAGTEER